MFKTVKKLLLVSRPISWPNTAYPFAAAYLVAGGAIDTIWVIGTLFFIFPYNLLMYGINDIFDYESDIQNPRKGGIEGMREQKAFHPVIVRGVLVTSVPFMVGVLAYGTPVSNGVFIGVITLVIGYSIKGLRLKERPGLDSITSSCHFAGPMLFAVVLQDQLNAALPFLVSFFLWGMASHAFGAVQDIIPDKKASIASIATYFGARRTVWFAAILYTLSAVILVLQGSWSILIGMTILAYVFNITPYLSIDDKKSAKTNAAWRRFIWLNFATGLVITITLILLATSR